ncbi:Succinate-semialdehyde dehydrogenase [NADP(+)] GabD [Candidatus Trichorickettsia mobilis]|uniref:Succinate-semialdehyde dehydrogenase [NADP(+)] GabD n=1 Tax=Candidatus Trichorickettsia mobilis TaxID=1346319 RepID=A0ABZ0UQF0_9RICK|nr:NAD-dependent succinate-semialdehyde dehydrogenase [Candidatus Trichorickettsia mobilis]WPY00275.1 Succinate-semialdehyde dehydrogenase [NADP(+)] GabD [Candidatus Trichorickettsia mobilis]
MELLNFINGKNYIAGNWVEVVDQLSVINPATGETIATVPNLTEELVLATIDNSITGFNIWSQMTVEQRSKILRSWHQLVLKHIAELAYIVTIENGKILEDAKREILYGAAFIEWFTDIMTQVSGTIVQGNNFRHKVITEYEPVGLVAAITPWNFPSAMVARKLAPALAAGCSVILKPSSLTPLSALALVKLAADAGLPPGVVNVITGDSNKIGKIITQDFRIRKLSFTGSTEVGKKLYQDCAGTIKRLSLELGGNAPFIIFADADLEKTAADLITAKIRSGGQSCVSPNRIFIEEIIYDQFIEILVSKFASLKVGNGIESTSDIGPLINAKAVEKILDLLSESTNSGAKIICGGKALKNFLDPTIVIDCNEEMKIFHTEIFGPVIACYKFKTIEQVIELANKTEYGLQAYIYSSKLETIHKMSAQLDFGMVSVNSPLPANAKAAFAGRKASGFGIEGSRDGIYEYLNTKYVNLTI